MAEIKKLIKKGEGKTIEFKRTLPDGNHIAKTVIAFSNMAGGKIIIGIEDKTGDTEKAAKEMLKGTTIETTIETTVKSSGEKSKISRKVPPEEDIDTSRETTAIAGGDTTTNTTAKTTAKSQKELTDKVLQDKKIPIATGGEIAEGKKTTIETTIETTANISNMLIELIKKNPNATLRELGKQVQMTKDGVRYHLKNLKKKGILKRIGSSRVGQWKINEDRLPQ